MIKLSVVGFIPFAQLCRFDDLPAGWDGLTYQLLFSLD
jgi:hypothetical protein